MQKTKEHAFASVKNWRIFPLNNAIVPPMTLFPLVFLATMVAFAESGAQLEAKGEHRVQPGETIFSLAKRAGVSTNLFYRMNSCRWDDPKELKAGEIVIMKNPVESMKVTGCEKFAGRYSLHEYDFRGYGESHVNEADEHSFLRGGADVSCSWSVQWPENGCGLTPSALEKLRSRMIESCFGANFYESEGVELPKTIEAVERKFRSDAWRLVNCDNDGWRTNEQHVCSHWSFVANARLSWPFGMTAEHAEPFARPVICFVNEGYSNDGGNGCHSYVSAHVYSLSDGRELREWDYFRSGSMKELFAMVLDRLLADNKLTIEDTLEKDRSKIILEPGSLSWIVSKKGVTWWVGAYEVFPGCCGVTQVTISWKDLRKFLKN